MNPRDAIAEWYAKGPNEENAIRLMTRLVSYSPWIVEITPESARNLLTGEGNVAPKYPQDTNGQVWAFVFSDEEAYRAFLQQTGGTIETSPHIEVNGITAFGTAMVFVDRIAVNAYSPQHITYQRPQFAGLRTIIEREMGSG